MKTDQSTERKAAYLLDKERERLRIAIANFATDVAELAARPEVRNSHLSWAEGHIEGIRYSLARIEALEDVAK